MPVVGMPTTDTATGAFISRSAIMAGYGQMNYRFYLGAPPRRRRRGPSPST